MISSIYIAEFIGTTLLLFLGTGVVANVNLKKTNARKKTKAVEIKKTSLKTKKSLSFYEWLHKWGIG